MTSTAPAAVAGVLEEPSLQPVSRAARIAEMDYVRGLAVLGIFLVNMPLYNAPSPVYFNNEATGWFRGPYDQAALWFIRIVAESKFYTLFSFLFGLGFGVQLTRAAAAGVPRFARFYSRRLAILFAIGILHMLLFWWGDVLHLYALLGFMLLLFRKRSQKTILAWAAVILLLPAGAALTFVTVQTVRDTPQKQAERVRAREEERGKTQREIEEQTRIFSRGSRAEAQALRFRQARTHIPREGFWAIEIFSMFLAGLWFARSRMLEDVPGHLDRFRRWFRLGLFAGVTLTLVLALVRFRAGPDAPLAMAVPIQVLGHAVARPLQALFYGTGIVLLVQRESWRRRLAPMAAVGRMALTNYLAHTVVCVTLFNGVGFGLLGFGLYGKVGPAAGLALTFLIYAVQLAGSPWWLRRYRFGPVEWAWRSLTYGRKQPMALA
jgi:uncharacterized protein